MPNEYNKDELIKSAKSVIQHFDYSKYVTAGSVGACLMDSTGQTYTGICIDTKCSMGFCAEHSAIAEMLKNRQSRITAVVAVHHKTGVIAPCGRCRELMFQINPENLETDVILKDKTVKLSVLLPECGFKD